jgi:hypothetical protein
MKPVKDELPNIAIGAIEIIDTNEEFFYEEIDENEIRYGKKGPQV